MKPRELTFLVVEDQPFQRNMLVQMLKGLDAKAVFSAADGRIGLDVLERSQSPPDVIISDLDMPNMDGMEFIRHVGELASGTSLIIASAMERDLLSAVETMAAAYGVSFLGTIEKPVTPAKLENLLENHKQAKRAPHKASGRELNFSPGEIEAALKAGEFEPFFQPKVEIRTGAVVGAEALARWRQPIDGIVAPYAFVGAIEQDQLYIGKLTQCMLQKGAETCRAAREAGHEIKVSVNVSLTSLVDVTFADQLTAIVKAAGVDPRWMVVEITESAATTDFGTALENLARLRIRGFGLSIDDYGTGYSSLSQLMRIPFTELKVDQSFVVNARKREFARVILESSLQMAKRLSLTAVAEGVETEDDWNLLAELGCDVAQGYFLAMPMDAQAFVRWLKTGPRIAAA
jgi:EAL domain-containing protein (putative c-di-GMP-specific phosphodiesterase class I)/CheY-like chemotaxis protein